MTNKIAIIIASLHGAEDKTIAIWIKTIFLLMIAAIFPASLAVKMVAFVERMPLENKERVIVGIKDHQQRVPWRQQQYVYFREDPHYTRTDDRLDVYEDYYMEHEIEADRPRNQLLLYKRYVKQLEHKIKQLEEQLKCK